MAEASYHDVAQQIITIVGKDNIVSATHCATRLRLIVKDKDKIDGKALEKVPLVKGTFFNAGQYQIILGTGIVNKVFGEMNALGLSTLSKAEQDAAIKAQQKGIKRLMRHWATSSSPSSPSSRPPACFWASRAACSTIMFWPCSV